MTDENRTKEVATFNQDISIDIHEKQGVPEQPVTELAFLNRLGCPSQKVSPSRLLSALEHQLNDLLNNIYEFFCITDGLLRLTNSKPDETEELAKLSKEIVAVYYTAKLASLKCPSVTVENLLVSFSILLRLFEDLLKNYSEKGSDGLIQEDLNILFAFGLLLSALSRFVDGDRRSQTEPILVLLISLTGLQQLVDSFKMILLPAHQSRLFTLTLYRDLENIQASIQAEDADQIAKLKAIMELAFIRYGEFFLSSYTEELLFTLNCTDLLECPEALWNKATHGQTKIQTDLGPSFLVSMLKYQWAIIKDFQGLTPDPSNEIILFHTDLEDLFKFLSDQAQQLFLLTSALHTVLNEDTDYSSSFNTDADTLNKIYIELMDHLVRIVSALMEAFAVLSQNEETKLTRIEQMNLLQSTKFHVILLIFSLCSIQLSLAGPLHISTAPSISPVIELYLSKSDFTAASDTFELSEDFCAEFVKQSPSLYSNYSMLKGLSNAVQDKLSSTVLEKGILSTKFSLNMLSFCVLVVVMFFIQLTWFIQAVYAFIDDFFLY